VVVGGKVLVVVDVVVVGGKVVVVVDVVVVGGKVVVVVDVVVVVVVVAGSAPPGTLKAIPKPADAKITTSRSAMDRRRKVLRRVIEHPYSELVCGDAPRLDELARWLAPTAN
jgi:hypothetical protein